MTSSAEVTSYIREIHAAVVANSLQYVVGATCYQGSMIMKRKDLKKILGTRSSSHLNVGIGTNASDLEIFGRRFWTLHRFLGSLAAVRQGLKGTESGPLNFSSRFSKILEPGNRKTDMTSFFNNSLQPNLLIKSSCSSCSYSDFVHRHAIRWLSLSFNHDHSTTGILLPLATISVAR